MSKLTLLALAAVAVGIFGGVIEVKWHPDKLSAVPGNITEIVQDGSLIERGRAYITSLKRTGEFWLIRDERQRLEIATTYISVDSQRLDKLLLDNREPAFILPQARLLAESMERAKDITGKASVNTVASLQAEAKTALREAAATVERLTETHADYKDLEQKFANVVSVLAKQLGSWGEQTGDVAGAKDTPTPTPSPSPSISAIQLNF